MDPSPLPPPSTLTRRSLRERLRGWARDPGAMLPDLAVLLMCAVAAWHGRLATRGLSWPCDVDLYRDMGVAQSMVDGRPLADPLFFGEWLWYNPLVPFVVAFFSTVSGKPVHLVATHIGVWANLAAPLCFYVMAASLLGRRAGVAAVVAFLFLPVGRFPAWASATYSPWFFPQIFVQSLFYLGVWASARGYARPGVRGAALCGALLGLTFLGHGTPALLLGVLVSVLAVARVVRRPRAGNSRRDEAVAAARDLSTTLAVAAVVSLPYTLSVVGHYGLDVQNPEPSRWIWFLLDLRHLGRFLEANLSATLPVTALGLLALLWRGGRGGRPGRPVRILVLSWLLLAAGGLAYSFVVQAAQIRGTDLPLVAPGHHFLLYLKAAEVLLLGRGLLAVAELVTAGVTRILALATARVTRTSDPATAPDPAAARVTGTSDPAAARVTGSPASRARRAWISGGILGAVLGGAFWVGYPMFRTQEAFTTERIKAKILRPDDQIMRAFHWILDSTHPTDVFLADDHYSLHLISPAGRKVVAMVPYFANPFVAWEPRHKARHELFSLLSLRRADRFLALARKHRVDYVVMEGSQAMMTYGSNMAVLERAFSAGSLNVFRVRYPDNKRN